MDSADFLKTLDERASKDAQATKDQQGKDLSVANTQAVIDTIGQATKALITFQSNHQPKVSVTNQKLPTSIKTPDIQRVVDALENLKQPLQENKPDDTRIVDAVNKLNDSISKLPTSYPEAPEPVEEVTVKNQPDYKPQFDKLSKSIEKIDVKPVINIPEEKPDDYTPIIESLTSVVDAVKNIKIPKVPQTDLTPLIQATDAVQQSIQNLKFPVANYILPFQSSTGKATQVILNADGTLPISATISAAITNDGTFAKETGGNLDEIALDTDNLAGIKTGTDKIPSQGQALAAGSLPVVLPAAQITTLTPPAALTNYANETGGNLATIAGKDFATQTTLALIKAKTDNLDVALSSRTKPADQQHVIVDSGVTTGLTDTQLRATPVPVSGTVNPTTPTAILGFVTAVTTAGTRVQLASNACLAGIVQAPSTNTGIVYVGGSTVSATVFGAELQPGQASGIAIDNTSKLWIDAATNGDKVAFFGS